MSLAALEAAIPPGDRLLLDSSLLIAYLNGGEPGTAVAAHILETFVRLGRNHGLVSAVSAMEILVRPLRVGPPAGQHVVDFLNGWPNLQLGPVDLPVALQAANLRAFARFTPSDALVAATGLAHGVNVLVTNDDRWKRLPGVAVRVCCLEDYLPFP